MDAFALVDIVTLKGIWTRLMVMYVEKLEKIIDVQVNASKQKKDESHIAKCPNGRKPRVELQKVKFIFKCRWICIYT